MGTLGGLLASTLVVVIVKILLFLAISYSLSHLECNSANNLTFSSILTCMALVVAKGFSIVSSLAAILLIKEDCAPDKDEITFSTFKSFSSTVLLKAVCLLIKSLSMTPSSEATLLLLL